MFQAPYVLGKPRFRTSLYHVDQARSAPLEPPWPDLILTVGRRPSMAALWVKEQTRGRARLVVIGRPKRWLDRFDLVIAPPQFQLPRRANVLRLDLPLMRVDEGAIAAASGAWRERFADLPRPLIALLVGGPTKPYRFDQAVARQLMEQRPARRRGRGRLTLRHHQPPHAGRGGGDPCGRAAGRRASLPVARRRRQPLPRAARARRPVHRHRRQHLDDGRGGQAGQTARHLRAARGAARAALARHARPAPGGARGRRGRPGSGARCPTRCTGCASPSTPAICPRSTAACMRAGSRCRSGSRSWRRRRGRQTTWRARSSACAR